MGAALAYAIGAPLFKAFLIFTSVGIGMALPYVILSTWPALLKLLPRPGPWMLLLKQFLSFPMFATTLWLTWVLGIQVGMPSVFLLLMSFIIVALGLWIYGAVNSRLARHVLAPCILLLGIIAPLRLLPYMKQIVQTSKASDKSDLLWESYSPQRLEELRHAGRPVYLDFTAAWCITCQTNKLLTFSSAELLDEFRRRNIALLKGDWTNEDEQVTAALKSYGRSGVPLNVYYPPGKDSEKIILPTLLTAGIVLETIKQAEIAR